MIHSAHGLEGQLSRVGWPARTTPSHCAGRASLQDTSHLSGLASHDFPSCCSGSLGRLVSQQLLHLLGRQVLVGIGRRHHHPVAQACQNVALGIQEAHTLHRLQEVQHALDLLGGVCHLQAWMNSLAALAAR